MDLISAGFCHFRKLLVIVSLILTGSVLAQGPYKEVRVATFNIRELSTEKLLHVDGKGAGQDKQLQAAARIIQNIRPDILIINEIDQDYNSL